MLKELIKKVDYYWFFLVSTIFVCFGYFLTNPTIGIDDELVSHFTSIEIILQVGRLGKFLTNLLFQPDFVPVVYDAVGLFAYVLSILIIVDVIKKYATDFSKKEATIFSTIAISFPFAAFVFIYIQNCIDLGLCFLLASLSLSQFLKYFYDEKNKFYILQSFLLLFCSVSFYETGVFYFLIGTLFVVLYNLMFDRTKENDSFFSLKLVAFSFLTVFVSIVSYRLVLNIVQTLLGYSFDKVSDYLKYDFSSFNTFFKSVYFSFDEFIKIFVINVQNHFSCKVILFSILFLLITSIIYSVIRKNILITLLAFFLVVLPFSYFVLTGDFQMPYRIFFACGLVDAISFVVLQKIIEKHSYILKIYIAICFLIVFHQAKEMNLMFYTEHLKYENDKFIAYSIDKDLKILGYNSNPVVFVGAVKPLQLEHSYYLLANEINPSIFNWDRIYTLNGELLTHRPYKFMQQIGYDILPFFDSDEKLNQYSEQLKQVVPSMPIYPNINSIKKLDDFVIVKLGESKLDK